MEDGRFDRVRQVMQNPIDVDLPEGLAVADGVAGSDGDGGWDGIDPGPPPSEDAELPPEAACVDFPLNDVGNGLRLLHHFGADLQRVSRLGWFVWRGTHWRLDPDEIDVRRQAHRLSDLIAKEIHFLPMSEDDRTALSEGEEAERLLNELGVIKLKDRTEDQIAELAQAAQLKRRADEVKERRDKSIGRRLTHAKNAGNSNAIKNLLCEAGAIVARPLEDFDSGVLDINTLSGVLRFTMIPGEDDGGANPPRPVPRLDLVLHDRAQLISKVMPVAYDPEAQCPLFLAYLARIMPLPEMRRFLQRWFGYSMTALTHEQKFAFFYGSGANGKSVLVDLMARLMGDYAASAKIESITGKNRRGGGDATPDLMPLVGARFVRTSEPDEGQRLQEGLIKELTGGEPILVRALNENFVLIYPIFKLTVSGNHRPEIHGGDDGIWRRVLLVPFDVQIPPAERDPDLGAKLWAERDGILNWLVAGLMDYLGNGLQVPEAVTAATAEYRADSDPIATFLTSVCAVTGDPKHSLRAADLAAAVAYWMEEQALGAWTPRTISKRLNSKQGKWRHPTSGQGFTRRKSSDAYFDGIALLEPFAGRFADHRSRGAGGSPSQGRFDD